MPSHRSWSLCLLGLGTTLRVRVNLVNLFNHVNVGYRYHEGGGTWRDVDTVTLMATDEPREVKDLSSGDVARLTKLSQATVLRIPPEKLPYWTTPLGHRRYRLEDVQRYAHEALGRDVDPRT